jgi:hypothetical protein
MAGGREHSRGTEGPQFVAKLVAKHHGTVHIGLDNLAPYASSPCRVGVVPAMGRTRPPQGSQLHGRGPTAFLARIAEKSHAGVRQQ